MLSGLLIVLDFLAVLRMSLQLCNESDARVSRDHILISHIWYIAVFIRPTGPVTWKRRSDYFYLYLLLFFLNVSVSWWGQWLQLTQTQLLIAKRDTAVKIKRRGFYFCHGSSFTKSPATQEYQFLWGKRMLRYLRSWALSSGKQMCNPARLPQTCASSSRKEKCSPCHEIWFSGQSPAGDGASSYSGACLQPHVQSSQDYWQKPGQGIPKQRRVLVRGPQNVTSNFSPCARLGEQGSGVWGVESVQMSRPKVFKSHNNRRTYYTRRSDTRKMLSLPPPPAWRFIEIY